MQGILQKVGTRCRGGLRKFNKNLPTCKHLMALTFNTCYNETKSKGGEGLMQSVKEILDKLIPELTKIFDGVLESVILYGSVARQAQTEESDVDIAVIVKGYTEKMYDSMIDATVELELEYGKVLSVLLIDYDNFKEWENVLPFYKNVKEEGVILWKTA
jgi:predicted nucleotidyltransferase